MDEQEEVQNISISALLDQVLDGDDIPISLLAQLSDMAPDDFEKFKKRWPLTDDDRRPAIAQHMAHMSEDNFAVEFSPIFGYMLDDPLAEVRRAALDGLWDTANTVLVGPMIRLMKEDESVVVRKSAASSLGHFVLMGVWGQISAKVKDRIVVSLLERYRNPETHLLVKRAALESLGAADHALVPQLIEDAYEQGERELQESALFAMGVSADTRWLSIVLDELESPWSEMRAEAARAAGEIGSSSAVELLSELAYDEDLGVTEAVITALGKIGGDQATRVLSAMLEDEDLEDFHQSLEETMEDMEWGRGEIDLDDINWDPPEM